MKMKEAYYVDTPNGIFSEGGYWFAATEKMLRRYSGKVFDRESLGVILAYAEVWLRSHQTLALWALPLFLMAIHPLPAVLAALTLFIGWRVLAPAFASRVLAAVLRFFDLVWLQGLFYVFALSFLAVDGGLTPVVIGITGFILMRWGVLDRVTEPLCKPLWNSLYPMTVADQILRGFIIRSALANRVALPDIEEMERRLVTLMNKKK
jgi:hypothetical protein